MPLTRWPPPIVIFGGNTVITHVGTFGAIKSVELGWLSIPFTYFSIIGVTNAINLIDGLNGLAGGVSLIGFLFIGIAAASTGNVMVALVCFAFVGALVAFLLFNFPNAKIFMGDSGSLFLGFSLSLMAIHLTQGANSPVEPMMPVVVLLLPIFDALRVLFVRLMSQEKPFPGRQKSSPSSHCQKKDFSCHGRPLSVVRCRISRRRWELLWRTEHQVPI